MLKVIDRFTTRDGSWEPDGKPFSITQVAAEKYRSIATGAATHLFVRMPELARIAEFNTQDGKNPISVFANGRDWINFPMFAGHKYNPSKGEVGPGILWIDGEKVAEGIGLPYGWHVSTFLVVEDALPDVGEPPTPLPPTPGKERWTLYRNGILVFDSEG